LGEETQPQTLAVATIATQLKLIPTRLTIPSKDR
jgi:hypothetical protein